MVLLGLALFIGVFQESALEGSFISPFWIAAIVTIVCAFIRTIINTHEIMNMDYDPTESWNPLKDKHER